LSATFKGQPLDGFGAAAPTPSGESSSAANTASVASSAKTPIEVHVSNYFLSQTVSRSTRLGIRRARPNPDRRALRPHADVEHGDRFACDQASEGNDRKNHHQRRVGVVP
jgi:hypothetical protein